MTVVVQCAFNCSDTPSIVIVFFFMKCYYSAMSTLSKFIYVV